MKYCSNCGAQLEDDARFCASCGAPVSDAGAPTGTYNGQDISYHHQEIHRVPGFLSPRAMKITAYLSVVGFIMVLIINRDLKDPEMKYYLNQAVWLNITFVAGGVLVLLASVAPAFFVLYLLYYVAYWILYFYCISGPLMGTRHRVTLFDMHPIIR